MNDAMTTLRRTPLHARHIASGARFVSYGGWDMPLEYSGLAREHMAVRKRAGLFDVSHMGEIEVAGQDALAAVQRVSSNDASALAVGQTQYSGLLTPRGTFLDDMLVYRMAPSHFMLVVNAANTARDFAWISEQAKLAGEAAVVDSSSRYALIAVQGPAARDTLQALTAIEIADIGSHWFSYGEVAAVRALVSRTGYTGEDGYEIFVAPAMADRVWQALVEAGRSADVIPCGLGARDTLRLEAAMRLYGSDIDETTTALEAGLGWTIGWDKGDFTGREALLAQRTRGVDRRLVGVELLDRGIARPGCTVLRAGLPIGAITSGTQTPYLGKAIGLAYVSSEAAEPGTGIDIDIRGRTVAAQVVALPFYRRAQGT